MGRADGAPDRTRLGIVVRDTDAESLDGALRTAAADLLGRRSGRAVVCVRLHPPTPVSRRVVDAVVDALIDAGCTEVTVGATLSAQDRDRGHRSVSALGHLAGLTGRTARGRPYDVADLGDDTVLAPVPATSVLDGQRVSSEWVTAGTRVVIGRAVTDLLEVYAGCLDALSGVVPEVPGADSADVVVDVLRHLPATLAVVDATATSHGPDGARLPRVDPATTQTVVVTADALLADTTLATLLGVDRGTSRPVRRALDALGAPAGTVAGELAVLDEATHPHPLLVEAARHATTDRRLERLLAASIGGPDEGAASADPVLSAVRAVITPIVAAAEEPVGQAALIGLLTAVASASAVSGAWSVGLDKDRVGRRVVPLGFDPAAYPDNDIDDLPAFLSVIDDALAGLPPADEGAMRWRLVDGATVFEVGRDIPADFDEFVARVDVAEGIALMADYLGGRRVELVRGPPSGTSTRQAERNLYLPQPNYLAAWGGEPIDVCKIELVERGLDEHRLLWRTVHSPNGSATYDDGSMSFRRTATGTRATVRGRQLFTLPLIWQQLDLGLVPEVHDALLEDAYRRFFTTTFDNLEARFEGREFRIGRPPPDPDEPLVTTAVELVLAAAQDWLRQRVLPAVEGAAPRPTGAATDHPDPEPDDVDALGFRHVRGRR